MSFCRITGRSRGLPKPNYFPLLPPISPADAKRFCRITGKSYGLPTHHYIPVLLGVHKTDKSKCRVTNNNSGAHHQYTAGFIFAGEKRKHVILKDYRYVFPVLEGDGEQQKALRELLRTKEPLGDDEENLKFVYTVNERRCSLVFPAQLEAAVRDGDVKDVMLSRDCDTVLLRLKQGKSVSVDFRDFGGDDLEHLYDGLGPREDVLKERERLEANARKRKKKRANGLNYAKKIFEDKEKAADEAEEQDSKKMKLNVIKEEFKEEIISWKDVDLDHARVGRSQLTAISNQESLNYSITTSCNWESLTSNAGVTGTPIVEKLPTPVQIEAATIDIESTAIGVVTSPISEETGGLEAISIIKPLTPLNVEPDPAIYEALVNLTAEELEETADVKEKLLNAGKEALEALPTVEEISKLVENVEKGNKHEINKIKGLKIDIDSAQRFVTGKTVQTPNGPVFVPGQTLQTPKGQTFVPGFTVHTPSGPVLIPGQIVSVTEENKQMPVFIAGQTLETKSGVKFVQGQTMHTSEGAKFVMGQTVFTEEGPKFVAGLTVTQDKFVAGQTIVTEKGAHFMPGQTITNEHGEHIFVPGQSVKNNEVWRFVPGQCLSSSIEEPVFVPGKTMQTSEGLRFVAGQSVTTESGKEQFVPGMTVKTKDGPTFVPGTTLDTPQGPKFVQGMVIKTPEGERFVPGTTVVGAGDSFEFAAAKSVKDITFLEAGPVGIPVDPKTANTVSSLEQQEIFGHMVQTEHGVEFIPESKKIPESKRIVPGQLVRGGKDGPRFVPGMMTEEGFLPGQIVITEKGDQFIPGQVVETSTGPKFVPGRMVETRTGPKFVPGQTMETTDGPRFVPGQIVQTKVGPTFIPGQVITTENKGSRFVPGQVVDTPDGPRFVPGRVVESGELGVTFVPGQIVQTEEGPRFVAPDLMDTPEGEMEFSVQGFEVTPEELALLRPDHLHYNATSKQHHEPMSIDARMLKQLSEAGMSVGRKISAVVPNVNVDVDPTAIALENALVIAKKLGLKGDSAVKMAQIVSTVSQLANNIVNEYQNNEKPNFESICNGYNSKPLTNGTSHQNGHTEDDDWLHEAVKGAIATAILAITDIDDQTPTNGDKSYVLSSISEAFNVFLRQGSSSIEQSVDQVLKILMVPQSRTALCQTAVIDLLESNSNKVDLLKSTIVRHSLKSDIVLERLSAVLEEEHGSDLVGSAFRAVSKDDPELVLRVLEKVSQEVAGVATDREAAETVHKAIVQAVRESSELHVKELLLNDNYDGNNNNNSNLRELILQAVGLARALGMSTTASSLLAVISDEKSTKLLANDRVTLDILKRLTVMRKLAEERPQFIAALRDLTSDPEMARSDPHLRTLVRESAALMIVPEDAPLQSSVDVPTALLNAENSLAIEDFLMRKSHRPSTIFMILKHGLQAVVPREAAHAVLTGQVAYTVLDENGITHFEPLHVFNALRLNKPTAHRFSMYACPVAGDDDFEMELIAPYGNNNGNAYGISDSVSSYDACSSTNGCYYSPQDYSSGVTLTRSDRTIENSVSRENTPCFRRLSCLLLDDRGTADNFIVVKDYASEEDNGFAVKIGDIVEAIEFNDDLTKRKKMDPDLEIGEVGACLDNSAARHKLSVRPKRRHVDPRSRVITRSNSDSNIRALVKKIDGQQGWLPMSILMQTALSEDSSTLTSHRPEDSQYRREAVVKELVETEEEFGRDLQQVVERYLKPLDNPGVPRAVRDNKEIIFTNFKQIADFHNTVLIEGVKYYADQPRMLGKTFLRLERDFDKHVAYCRDEPAAQEFLQTSLEVRDYFEELSQTLGDDKSVSEHLKLPIQRINDYQLLLKELVKYSTRLGENCDDLQKALELMLGIPHRATDNKFISNIEGYKGNIHKLGRLLTHEWFTVVDKDGKSKERYLFLFKARILVCKVRRISEDRSVFVLKDIIKLPEVEVKDYPDDQRTFELHNPSGATGYPLTLIAHKDLVKAYWLKEIRQYSSDLLALAEHAADDLQLSEEKDTEDSKVRKLEGTKIDLPPQAKKYQETTTKIPVTVEPTKPQAPLQTSSQASLPTLPQASSTPPAAEVKTAEKRESLTKVKELEAKKVKTEESQDMSKYSSSHFSASSKVVEEYSSVSSSRNGSTSYVETSSSSLARAERRASSSLYSSDKITESSGSYETAIGGSSETKTSKLAVTAAETVKPKFVKTIEGISAEPIHAKQAIIHVIAGESATFECTLESSSESCRMHWLKDNKPLDDKIADRVKITSTDKLFKLEITNVSASDSGIYTARAANGEGNATCTAQLVVESLTAEERKAKAEAKAPVFLVRLKDTELLENTYLRFMIKVKGDPTPDVKFYKDGKLIDATNNRVKIQTDEDKYKSDKGFYELVIPDVQKQDAGIYSCTATNKFGEATCEATVSVTDEKTLFAGLPEGVFEAGTETQFRWLRDGKPFNPEDRFKVLFEDNEDTLALVFQHVKPEDAGLYTCVAQTSTGNISCSAELTVQGNVKQLMKDPCKPALGSESRQSEVSAGGSAMLDLQVRGFPKPDIKWSKDGKEIVAGGRIKYLWEDEESVSLVIKNVTVEDAGTYTIRAKNELGEDETYIELIVKSAPKFIKKQTDTFAYIETEGKMTVQIQASPAPEVKWYKDGQILEASDRLSMTRDGDHYSLIIKECRLDDIGSYSVIAKNEINQTSEFWNFDVRCPPKIKKKLGEPKVIDEGDTLTLLIEVENTPEPTVVWLKDEIVIKEDQRIQIINEGPRRGLKITGTVDIDAATYKAEVSNKDGTTIDQVDVEVRSAPRFKKEMTDVIAREGDAEVKISIEVAGYPRPSLQWFINDMEITEDKTEFSKSQEGDVHTLKITDVKTEHAGRYTCRLKNQYGKKESKANLTVYCRPKLLKKLADQKLNEGATLKLQVQVAGTPTPDVKWFKDGKEVSADARIIITRDSKRQENYDLTVNLLKGSDGGTYEVRATNEMGYVSSKSKVIILTKTEETVEKKEEEKAEEDVEEPQGPEGNKVEKITKTKVVNGKDGDMITISVESTTEHQATMSGPDECHTISKMKTTKVECQELNTEEVPLIEEIPSYSFTLKDNTGSNGIVEEFSDKEDMDTRLKVNRGVSIVSVSDDESMKALSRDVSGENVNCQYEIKTNGGFENSKHIEENIIEEYGPNHAIRYKETIIEECYVDDGRDGEAKIEMIEEKSQRAKRLSRQTSKLDTLDSTKVTDKKEVNLTNGNGPHKAEVGESKFTRQNSKLERMESEEKKIITKDLESSQIPEVEESKLSRQSSKIEKFESEEKKSVKKDLESSQTPEVKESKLSRQSSKVEKLESEEKKIITKDLESSQTPEVKESKLSRQSSKISRVNSVESKAESVSNLSRQSSQARSNSIVNGNNYDDDDDADLDDKTRELFSRIKRQRSVLEEILDKEADKKDKTSDGLEAAPSIVSSDFEDCTVFATQNKTFTVHGTGLPRPDAKWFKDGNPLRSADKAKPGHTGEKFTLSFTKLTENETALYQLVLSNKLGTISVDAYIEVAPESELRKPRFTEPLQDIDAEKNGAGTFQCVLTADPIPDVIWSHEGVDLSPENDKYKMERSTKKVDDALIECTYNLTVSDCTLEDVGKYTLRAENKWGDDSSNARLELLVQPEILEFKELNAAVEELSKWEVIIKSNPRAELTWEKDGIILDDENRFAQEDNYRDMKYYLVFKCVEYDDAGVYKVTAKNYLGEDTAEAELVPYTEPPEFLLEITNGSVRHDAPIEFKIEAKGIARPKIQWLLNGDEIIPDERHIITTTIDGHVYSRLRIEHFQQSDEGELTCVATNRAGKAKSKCTVSMIRLPPTFAELLPRSQQIEEDAPLVFDVEVDGSPFPKVTWFKDGEEIKPDDHVKIETQPNGSTKLTIEKCTPTDSGAYKIIAKNNNGESTSQCAVAIKPTPRKPSFSKPLEDVTVTAGQPLKLEAQVVAFPSPEVQWFKDGLPVRQSPDIEFINEPNGLMGISIDKVKPENAGTYSLVVKNKLGDVTGKAVVTVEAKEKKPEFLSTLQPMTVVEGFPAKMEVKIVGKPLPLIAWTYNGVEIIPDGTHIKIVSQPDGTQALLIDKVTVDDAGEYGVAALNTVGEEECKGILNVSSKSKSDAPEEKPCFLGPLRDTSIEEGEPLTFSASFAGNPMPDVFWTKDGEPIEPSDRILMTCDGKKVGLEINPTTAKDAGVYRCRLVNPSGEDASNAIATVRKVFQRPNFTQKFTDLQQVPGNDAKFAARITGIPRPDVSWYFNDKPIPKDADKYIIKRDGDACSLFVKDCSPSDAGKYKCRAINKDGDASCEALLTVADKIDKQQKVEPPSFLKRIGDCEVYKGMTAKFTACATGIPDPSFEWYRNDERLWPTDRIRMDEEGSGLLRLTILNVEEHDVGKYSLRIINPHGEDTCHAEMRYETLEPRTKKPLADQYSEFDKYRKSGIPLPLADRPIISRMMDRHLTLSWKPSIPIGPRVPVTYLVEMCEQPDGDWFTARSGIRSCVCDIRNLEPFRDYKFRIRVENKYGISDPSPFAQTYRSKLLPDPPKFHPYLPPGIDFRPETSPYFPKDFDIERPPHDGYAQIPKFLRQEHDTQYGVKNHNCNLFWFVYGYPKPKMTYYFNNELIESGGRYDQSYTRNGQATLFINKMLERDVGMYEAIATNEHGEARQRVRLEIAEYPTFIQRPEESYVMLRRNGHIQARVTGVPFPELKWYKDWKPLTSTARVKIDFFDPDTSVLTINDAIVKDEGLYSISARNVAGSVSCSVMVHIEENEHEYGYRTYTRNTDVKTKAKPFDEFYDLGDELGRGTQGVTYHAVERSTGRNFAAKLMHGRGELKPIMLSEMNAMNHLNHRRLIRLHDAYETDGSLNLVMELAAGGELVDTLTRQPFYNEYEIANYIRQILQGLEYMHNESWAHLSLTLGDLLISHSGGDSLKITDFGLARRISYGRLMTLVYGMPEYVAPEVVNEEGVTYAADMWSLGIITHILLSGISPFRGANDRETLTKIKNGTWDFDERWWQNISTEARDFIRCLLVYKVDDRMDVTAALRHPWLNMTDRVPTEPYKIPSENLKNYYTLFRDWYGNASCRTWYRRRKLSSAFEHPSRMVYPPGHRYTPEPEERPFTPTKRDKPEPRTWENKVPSRVPIDTEIGLIKNESHYQNGPDTYLLQLRDTDFPVRLREYMKVAHNRGSAFARVFDDEGYDWRTPIIRERRRFTDVMDEEIDDERKARINNYGAADCHTMRRLRHELGTRLDSYAEAEAMMETKKGGHLPFLREKPQMLQIQCGKCAQLTCLAVGNPKPAVQWFKNDLVIQEGKRISIIEDTDGRSILSFNPAREIDIGIYKVVARNNVGQTVARTRVVLATEPGLPQAPEVCNVSDTEVLLRWKPPKDDGNSEVLCYNLQYKAGDSVDWIDVASNIDHEFYLVKDLQPNTSYHFRLAARNRIGWSEKGFETNLIQTKPEGAPKIPISRAMKHLQYLTESGHEIVPSEDKPKLNYDIEDEPIEWTIDAQFTGRYTFISEVYRGQFSMVVKGAEKESDKLVVAKILEASQDRKEFVGEEFQVLRSLRHERIALLEAAYWAADSPVAVFIMEKLQGSDVLTYLASRPEYTENCVATIITEVLDALQYLHWRGYCHLDIQPDNIVMASLRSAHIKLVDFGSAHKVSKLGTEVPQNLGHLEYRSPEVLNEELAYPQTDIWSVAVLTYVLLSGASPFKGNDEHETRQNISFVRYRFEYLYKEISQEATRFLMLLFKRTPSKRPTAEECHEHRWATPTEFMIKKRERASFPGSRLKAYNEEYHEEKAKLASKNDNLMMAFGNVRQLNRSYSTQDELITSIDNIQ
ncbi:obscurin isoform X2 [Microplitis demolitor]|uniref:obscurin isoform X2 n=1 Tax=Microplitis demolitor TaxID=69319 RepID=UPI00235B6E21|nr:obscurin isoform X2 [Microplitis demolitor]